MPRIRTLKPEHRQHRKVGPLSHVAYRLWVGMILEADDEGRLICAAEQLRVLIFGYHPKVTTAHIEQALDDLESSQLIRRWVSHARLYADFPSWHDHQRIDRKQPSKLPVYEHSSNGHRAFVTDLDLEGKGSEGKGREVGLAPDAPPLATKGLDHGPAAMRTAARELLAFLNKKAGRHYQPVDTNLDLIIALLRNGTTVDQVYGVIARKVAKWKGDPKMDEFMRPSTLFRPSNFQNYLGELPASAFEGKSDA